MTRKKKTAGKLVKMVVASKPANVDAAVIMATLEREAAPSIKRVTALVVDDQDSYKLAGELMKSIKDIAKIANEREEQFTVPLKKLLTDVTTLFKPFRDNVKLVEQDVKDKMLAHVEQSKKETLKLQESFDNGDIKKVSTLLNKQAAVSVDSKVRKTWQAVAVNDSLTLRDYLIPDVAKIKGALKNGKKVAGWEWRQVESIVI